jgi:uncharacterized protein (TIGR03437 family)
VASAQPQPWTISAYQGNGQLICISCNLVAGAGQTQPFVGGALNETLVKYAPLYAKVTDNNGSPVANAAVSWSITSGLLSNLIPLAVSSTTTDANGITYIPVSGIISQASQNGPVQSTVTATAAGSSNGSTAVFTLTQTGFNVNADPQITAVINGGNPYDPTAFSGTAGSSGATPITAHVFGYGGVLVAGTAGINGPLQNVSLRLVNYQSSPTVTCARGAGADPGSVLTDSNGDASCTPVFSGSGSGQFAILIGGLVWQTVNFADGNPKPAAPPYVSAQGGLDVSQQANFAGWSTSAVNNETVTAPTVSSIQIISGNSQSANQGTALAAPLVAQVNSAAGVLTNQPVTWSVSPAGAAVLSGTSTSTDASGRASTRVTFASSASGTVTITVTAGTGASVKTASFTATATIPTQLTGLTKLSGDGQTALVNTAFANPLVVQVNVASGSNANQTVVFSFSGPITLSGTSALTGSDGRAQVSVTAGAKTGAATVTASVGTFSTTFTLTVAPPGPQITAASFSNGADFQVGSLSPCSIASVIGPGLAPGLNGYILSNPLGVGSLNYTVATDTVTVGGAQAPIYNVANINGQQQVTFQVPCSVTPGSSVPVVVGVGAGSATVNVAIKPASPGVFLSANTINVSGFGALPIAAIEKRDGTFVSPSNPARVGETVFAFVTGLGPTTPAVATNSVPGFGVPSTVAGQVIVGIQNSGVPVTLAQLTQDMIGVYMVAFEVPANTTAGNLVFSIGLIPTGSTQAYYSNPAAIYVQ